VVTATDLNEARAWAAAAAVPDPEIPAVTVADLGILRGVRIKDGIAIASVTPTYTGCPAVMVIELAVKQALTDAGFDARIERAMAPAWTTDWITDEGREKLRAYGIAPPAKGASNSRGALFSDALAACPRCASMDTELISQFGSTPCKALRRCRACREPFDHFKCI
jgi:ring-1,2-phenylacetyl-CoA epoxidase subunit PaaD